jgi:hypothetical protein
LQRDSAAQTLAAQGYASRPVHLARSWNQAPSDIILAGCMEFSSK